MLNQFCFYPTHENQCGNVNCCPHLGGASVGHLVQLANHSGTTIYQLHQQIQGQEKRISDLVDDKLRLEKELEQTKLELKLERQNKFATNQQKEKEEEKQEEESTGDNEATEETPSTKEPKKRGAPVGHKGWFRPTPTEYDWMIEVPAPRYCPHCSGDVTAVDGQAAIDHLQEDIIEGVVRVVCYRHTPGKCDECGKRVQQPGKDEILGSRIGPGLRSTAIWLRNVIGISYRKIPQIIEELNGITFSPAALIGFETVLAEQAQPIVDDIAKKLGSSDGPVHADETYWTTNGARSYFWVHGNLDFIHFQYDRSRSGQVSRDITGADFTGTLVTDCYGGYAASAAGAKQKCLAHLARTARDWQKLTEPESDDFYFFEDVRTFVNRGCMFYRCRAAGQLSEHDQAREEQWLRAEQARLETTTLVSHEKALTLQTRLLNHTNEWLVFLEDPRVPPTNNLAERALRPLVVLRKITFGSRSDAGAKRMAKLMTVAETARRQGHRASRIYYELYTRPPDRVLRKLYAGG